MNSSPSCDQTNSDWEQIALSLAFEHWTKLGIISHLQKIGCSPAVAELAATNAQRAVVAESRRHAKKIIIAGVVGLAICVLLTVLLDSLGSGNVSVRFIMFYLFSIGAVVVGLVKLLTSSGDVR